jgi:hypothetical protein
VASAENIISFMYYIYFSVYLFIFCTYLAVFFIFVIIHHLFIDLFIYLLDARLQVFTVMKIQIQVYWDVTPYIVAVGYQCFGEPFTSIFRVKCVVPVLVFVALRLF